MATCKGGTQPKKYSPMGFLEFNRHCDSLMMEQRVIIREMRTNNDTLKEEVITVSGS